MTIGGPQPRSNGEMTATASRVLVIFPGALGDLICLGPGLVELARRHRDLELMARGELAQFACGRMGPRRAHSIDRRENAQLFTGSAPAPEAVEFFGAFQQIHSFFGADHADFRAALSRACSGPVHFHRFRPHRRGHVAAAYLRELGFKGSPFGYRLRLRPEDVADGRAELERLGIKRPVLLFPGSGSPKKNWPLERFIALARSLAPSPVLMVLGPAECHFRAALADFPCLIEPTLGCLAGLAQQALGFVGNDSGVSHLAAAAGAPGVVIFGPTSPARWRPLGEVGIVRTKRLDVSWEEVARALHRHLNGCGKRSATLIDLSPPTFEKAGSELSEASR